MKLTPLQYFRLTEAHRNSAAVLREIKQKSLKGKDLAWMKKLEETTGNIETLTFVGNEVDL